MSGKINAAASDVPPSFAVVVPAHQAEATIAACLEGILSAGFPVSEILVVDDGSTDASASIAREIGVRVVANAAPMRPAWARNHGAAQVDADILFFVDADVVIHGEIRQRLSRHFADASVAAVIGSYDDRCRGGSVVSDYRNLLHHHTHQIAPKEAQTFWTGIGAVRRGVFDGCGRLDRMWENIEDVEFGLRLSAAGHRIVMDADIQGTHLKVWTARSMFRTDLFGRALPWTRLLLAGRARTGSLNSTARHKIAAVSVLIMVASLLLAPIWPAALWLFGLGALVFTGANFGFLRRLSRMRGPLFALRAVPYHVMHYVAAWLGLIYAILRPRASNS